MDIQTLLSPIIILFAVIMYGVVHSLLASSGMKRLIQRRLGGTPNRGYRLVYNAFAVISLLPVLALTALLPDYVLYTIPSPWVYLTTSFQLVAVFVLLIGLLQTGVWSFLGLRQLVRAGERDQSDLVVKGLYRHVRHPLYTAGLVFIWLVPAMTVNVLALNVGLSLYLVAGALVEERKLLREFGVEYVYYREIVPMLIPRFRLKRSQIG
ncbi:MAG: isoprenylcysteine carboxylmethyltransferase family protein [Chloroflexota bacterium]|nr:isoprenylcysteine carboxylmethyltransferase family protein [Chloroflexota bacterium]